MTPERRATAALVAALLAWWAVRVAATLAPTMHAWSLGFGRDVPPAIAWTLLALPALALVPALARPLGSALDRADARGGWVARAPGLAMGALAAALVLALPDRAGFVGDSLLRLGTLREPGSFADTFPQAMPLDAVLHDALPRWFGEHTPLSPEGFARALGALEAAFLAWVALRFARDLGLAGARRIGVAAALAFGGYLALCTGYGKPTVEVILCTLAAGIFGLEVVRERRGALPFALAVSLALLLHRAALPLALPWLVVVALDWRARGAARPHAGRWPLALPLVTLAALAPQLAHVVFGFDVRTNFTSHEVEAQGGMLRTAFSGLRLLDDANVLLLHAPLLVAALVAAPWAAGPEAPRRESRGREAILLASLLAAFLPSLLFVYVTQGPFRDWDALGGEGAAAALASAVLLARALRGGASRGWLAVPVALAAIAPLVLVLASQSSLDRGLAHARRFLDEPPRRTPSQRLATLDYLGFRCMREGRWAEAAGSYERYAAEAPHTRALIFWGTSAAIARLDESGERAFAALASRVPDEPIGWFGLWVTSMARGDSALARRAEATIDGWPAQGAERARVSTYLEHYPEMRARLPRRAP